jgi:predicted alpha/beta superfamily hydrolase
MRSARSLLVPLLLLAATAGAADRPSTAGPSVQVLKPALEMPGLDRSRTLRIYLPPGYARGNARYPVIYMHDGQNLFDDATAYAGEWGVDEAMDELARRTGFEAIVVGIDNGGDKRMNELSPWPHPQHGAAEGEAYLRFVVEVVKPFVDRIYRTRPDAEDTAIIGSSMGGLASHYAWLARPDLFRRAGVLSPSYWFSDKAFDQAGRVAPPADARLYVYAGGAEGESMAPDAERMHRLFAARMGDRARLEVVPEGQHNEATWRAVFPRVVAFLFELDDDAAAAR